MSSNRKKVLCPVQRKDGKTFWMSVGSAFPNKDGSMNVYLDAYPSNGRLQIRELDERDLQPRRPHNDGGMDASAEALPF